MIVQLPPQKKRLQCEKEIRALEADDAKTWRSRTKLTRIKHAQNSIFLRIDIFDIRNCEKE